VKGVQAKCHKAQNLFSLNTAVFGHQRLLNINVFLSKQRKPVINVDGVTCLDDRAELGAEKLTNANNLTSFDTAWLMAHTY